MLVVILLVCIGQMLALVWVYHKLSGAVDRLSKQAARQSENTITQVEGLLALYAEIKPESGLPSMRGWAARPDFLQVLVQIAQERRPGVIVECSSGVSTLVLAACMKKQGKGRVYSLEHDPVYANKTRHLLQLHGLQDWAEVVDAPLQDWTFKDWQGQWYGLANLPEQLAIELLVIDGPPYYLGSLARYPALPALATRMASNAIACLDDGARHDEQRAVTRWLAEIPGLAEDRQAPTEKGMAILRWPEQRH